MDSIKTWLVEVALKKMGPSIIKGAIAALLGLMATHAGLLANIGITYDSAHRVISLNLDALSAWLLVVGSGGVMGLMTLLQHHAVAAVTGAPQAGTDPKGESK